MSGLNMHTRAHRIAQEAITGQSEPHTSIPMTARSLAKGPKGRGVALSTNGAMGSGRGAVQAAAVGSTPGIPDADLSPAQPHQLVLYEDVEADQRLPESSNLSKYYKHEITLSVCCIWHLPFHNELMAISSSRDIAVLSYLNRRKINCNRVVCL